MKRCVIIGAGDMVDFVATKALVAPQDYVICADAGYRHAQRMGVKVDLLLGDFDSLGDELPSDVEIMQVPAYKDDSDTMLAIKTALQKGYTHLVLLGMLGGRLDHTLANIQSLFYILHHGGRGQIESEDYTIYAIEEEEIVLEGEKGVIVSAFCQGDVCTGVDIENAKYPLCNATVTSDFPIGVSNEFLEGSMTIRVKKGQLTIFQYKKRI